jgi:hypothetical protein
MWWRRSALYLCGMVRRGDQEGAGFLSNPVRRGNNGIRVPTHHSTISTNPYFYNCFRTSIELIRSARCSHPGTQFPVNFRK